MGKTETHLKPEIFPYTMGKKPGYSGKYISGYQEPKKSAHIDIRFETDCSIDDIANEEKVDLDGFDALVMAPFTGRFYFYINGRDIMPEESLRRMYPFAYVGWLIENYNTYMNESAEGKRKKGINPHILAYGMGDASPKIILYRKGPVEVVKPLLDAEKEANVDAAEFSRVVEIVSQEALDILDKNKRSRESSRFKSLKELMQKHYLK